MHRISKDSPAYFFTVVIKDRLPVFRMNTVKIISCQALDKARRSGGFAIYAYVIMPDHIHLITDPARKPSDTLRFINGIIARHVIDYLKENNFESSLKKLRREREDGDHKYSLWEHHSNTHLITTEPGLMQKVNYIHQNPVADGLCERAEEYKFSSARYWLRKPLLEDEPLEVDIKKIDWWKGR
jgi:REP element-mobilizing transposase RayT